MGFTLIRKYWVEIVSVFVVYLTVWHSVETELALRYVLHGAFGWMFHFFSVEKERMALLAKQCILRRGFLRARYM
jgi:hypothetical protein